MITLPRPSRRVILSWLTWVGILALATVALHGLRTDLEQVHVILVFLLIVLGGTAFGGRVLGVSLAIGAFLLIDYFFQAPFDRISVGSSRDWFVLVAFLVAVAVAMNLLARAEGAAARAKQHAREVAHLSRFASELLSAGRAGEALGAIVDVMRETLGAESCAVFLVHGDGDLENLLQRGREPITDLTIAVEVARRGQEAGERLDGTIERVFTIDRGAEADANDRERDDIGERELRPKRDLRLKALWIPLYVRGRTVGVLGATGDKPLTLDDAHWRFAHALRFYVAHAVERVRLVAATEHADAMREADRLRNALLASVSHDLRTPLTTIKVLAQESARQHDLEVAVTNARVIEEHADRLARVVSNVLDVTRLRAKTLPVRPEFNTAEDLVGAVARQCAGVLGGHDLERQIDEQGNLLAGCFDFVQSLRILTNLVENAVRYSPRGAPVMLSARREENELVFDVADLGPGVAPMQRERIFDPFYRVPGTAPDIGGTGLGLYIARALAEAQEGTLTYRSRVPRGSIFTLRLPAMDPTEDDALEPSAEAVE